MPIDNLDERLAKMNSFFDSAPEETDPYALPEPGTYVAKLREIDFFEAKATGAAFVKFAFNLTQSHGTIDIVHCLEPQLQIPGATQEDVERKYSFLKKDLITLGVDVGADDFTLAQVRPGAAIWGPLLDQDYAISVRESKKINTATGKPYRNAYLDSRLNASDLPLSPPLFAPTATSIPVSTSDQIPF